MNLKVSEIFAQKINEIQSRVPVRIKSPYLNTSFQEVLDGTINNNDAIEEEDAIANSAADDKSKVMETIENV